MEQHVDQMYSWAMAELMQTTWWKLLVQEIDAHLKTVYTQLLEVREWQDEAIYTADQLCKRQIKYLEWLRDLPNYLVKATTSYTQDRSKEL